MTSWASSTTSRSAPGPGAPRGFRGWAAWGQLTLAQKPRRELDPVANPWHAKLLTARVWRVRAVLPHLGTAIYDLRTPTIHSLTTILAPALIVTLLLARIWRPTSARSREQE